eukprot:6315641-Lingulodinium_polyedra.AAC.1
MDDTWAVHGQSMDSPWIVQGRSGQSMECAWVIHSPWPVHGLPMDSSLAAHALSMALSRIVHGQFTDCPCGIARGQSM